MCYAPLILCLPIREELIRMADTIAEQIVLVWGLNYNEYHFQDSKELLPVVDKPSTPKTKAPVSNNSFDWLGSGLFALSGGLVTNMLMKPKKKL